ncbi:MAG: hypothetical protein U0792_11685 [Gemmataceae bacterium]
MIEPTPDCRVRPRRERHLGVEVKELVLFPAHAKTRGDVLLVPDLHARVSILDKENKPIVHLGDDEAWRKKVLDGFKVRSQSSANGWPAACPPA